MILKKTANFMINIQIMSMSYLALIELIKMSTHFTMHIKSSILELLLHNIYQRITNIGRTILGIRNVHQLLRQLRRRKRKREQFQFDNIYIQISHLRQLLIIQIQMSLQKEKTFFQKCNEVFLKMDLFSNPQYLKYKGQGSYQTYTGSIFSVIIGLSFIVFFYSMIMSTINREKINSVAKFKPSFNSDFETMSSNSSYMFAVGLEGFDLSASQRLFDIFMSAKIYKNSKPFSSVDIPLQPCKIQQWTSIKSQFADTFTRLNFSTWLCPPKDYNFHFKGKFSSEEYKFSTIVLRKCSSALGGKCANSTEFNMELQSHQTFKLSIYFANPIIDPSEKQYLDYTIEDSTYFQFTDLVGVSSQIFFSEYEVNTDNSVLPEPITSIVTEKGLTLIERPVVSNFEIINTDQYVRINLKKSDLINQYDRNYTRFDATLSYLGGLFGFLLLFFYGMRAFSEYAFQFQIGSQLFVYSNEENLESDKFNIIRFLLYLLYCIINFFYPRCSQWQCFEFEKKVDKCRDQVKQQSDVCFLIKRVIYIEKALQMFFPNRLHQIKIDTKWTLDEAKQKRQFYDNHEHVKKIILTSERMATQRKQKYIYETKMKQLKQKNPQHLNRISKQLKFGESIEQNEIILEIKEVNRNKHQLQYVYQVESNSELMLKQKSERKSQGVLKQKSLSDESLDNKENAPYATPLNPRTRGPVQLIIR